MWSLLLLLLPLLLQLISWLTKQTNSGKPLTARQQRKVNQVIRAGNEIRTIGVQLGCLPDGEEVTVGKPRMRKSNTVGKPRVRKSKQQPAKQEVTENA